MELVHQQDLRKHKLDILSSSLSSSSESFFHATHNMRRSFATSSLLNDLISRLQDPLCIQPPSSPPRQQGD